MNEAIKLEKDTLEQQARREEINGWLPLSYMQLKGFNKGVYLSQKEFLDWLQDYLYGNALDFDFCKRKEEELKRALGIKDGN